MREQPFGEQLLGAASVVLRDQLIPALTGDKRFAAQMIANAMAIVMRELHAGEASERREMAALRELLSLADDGSSDAAFAASLAEANRRLCRAIREGSTDQGLRREAVWRHLMQVTADRLALSNPNYRGKR